jgi:hypothetical protein
MAEALSVGPDRALRKRELRERRQAEIAGLALRGAGVLGGLGTDIYRTIQIAQEGGRDRSAAEAIERLRQAGRAQEFQREEPRFQAQQALGRAEIEQRREAAKLRGDDILTTLRKADVAGKYEAAGQMMPGAPLEEKMKSMDTAERAQQIQRSLFGDQARLSPDFYQGLDTEASTKGSDLRNKLIETLAAVRSSALSPEEQAMALSFLRKSRFPYELARAGYKPPVFDLDPVRGFADWLGGPGAKPLARPQALEDELLDELLGSGAPLPRQPEHEQELQRFIQRRAFRR